MVVVVEECYDATGGLFQSSGSSAGPFSIVISNVFIIFIISIFIILCVCLCVFMLTFVSFL